MKYIYGIKKLLCVIIFLTGVTNITVLSANEQVINISQYFHYETAVKANGYVVGWLELPHLKNAVLIGSKQKYLTTYLFIPKASEDVTLCNYQYINPDLPQVSCARGLYFWLTSVLEKKVELANCFKGSLLKPQFRTFYTNVGSFYSKKYLMLYPEELYVYLDGDYFLYEPNKKDKKIRAWDEKNKRLHPFKIMDIKKGLQYSSSDARDFVDSKIKNISFMVWKEK